jgi:predicted phosphodiesterase
MDIGYYDAKDFSIIKGPFIQNQTQTSTSIVSELLFPGTTQIFYREKGKNDWKSEKSKNASSISTVRIQNLKPDTEYEYYVKASYPNINPLSSCESDVYSFKTFPRKERPFSFLVIGDNRTRTEVFTEVCKKINEENQSEFILHTGDLVSNGRYYERWENEFFTPSKKLLAGKSIWIAIGNHEENSPLYYDFFNLPGNERYYYFDFLNSRFIALDSNLDYEKNSPQYKWLEQTLKDSQKNNIENIFVFTHHAIYTSSNHGKLDTNGIPVEKPIYIGQKDLVPLFEKYRVTAVFAGHDHTYERSLKNGITYITVGGGGAPLYKKSENAEKQNPYSKFFKSTEHYLIVSVNENSITINAKDITVNLSKLSNLNLK